MFVDLDWPLNASSLLSASAELLVKQYRRLTDTDPASHPASQPHCRSTYRAYYVARAKTPKPTVIESDLSTNAFQKTNDQQSSKQISRRK